MKKTKQYIIDIMKKDEELGLYDVFNDEKRQGVKELIDKHKQMEKETVCGKLPDNMGFPHFKTGIVEQPNEIPNKENGKVYKDQHGREFFQTEHGRIILTKQTRHLFDNINEQ
jgi:hypothetical protein